MTRRPARAQPCDQTDLKDTFVFWFLPVITPPERQLRQKATVISAPTPTVAAPLSEHYCALPYAYPPFPFFSSLPPSPEDPSRSPNHAEEDRLRQAGEPNRSSHPSVLATEDHRARVFPLGGGCHGNALETIMRNDVGPSQTPSLVSLPVFHLRPLLPRPLGTSRRFSLEDDAWSTAPCRPKRGRCPQLAGWLAGACVVTGAVRKGTPTTAGLLLNEREGATAKRVRAGKPQNTLRN